MLHIKQLCSIKLFILFILNLFLFIYFNQTTVLLLSIWKIDMWINLLLNKYFCYNFRIVLVNEYSTGFLFHHKERLNKGMLSSLVYKYVCPQYELSCIGSTSRNLLTRVAEHAGVITELEYH